MDSQPAVLTLKSLSKYSPQKFITVTTRRRREECGLVEVVLETSSQIFRILIRRHKIRLQLVLRNLTVHIHVDVHEGVDEGEIAGD